MTLEATGRASRWLALASCRRPWVTVAVALVLAGLGIAYAVVTLGFKTDTLDLLPPGAPYVERWRAYERAFGQFEDILVVVEAPAVPTAARYAERLRQRLAASPVGFRRVAYRTEAANLAGRGLLYLPVPALRELQALLQEHRDLLTGFAREPNLAGLVEALGRSLGRADERQMRERGPRQDSTTGDADPALLVALLQQIGGRLQGETGQPSPWGSLFSLDGAAERDREYFLSDDGRLLFVLVERPPADTRSFTRDREAIEALRAALAMLRSEFPDVRAGVTGASALEHDEMTAAFRDSGLASALAFALILVVIGVTLRGLRQPLLVLSALAMSLCWSVGVAALVVGHLTLFSVVFVPLVAGIGIDYGIYLLCRYREELAVGRGAAEALDVTATRTGPAIVLSAATAAGTFFVLWFTDFAGIQELGVIAGISIVLACLAMLTLLPALLILAARRADRRPAPLPAGPEAALAERATRRPRAVLAAAVLVTVLAGLAIPAVTFDDNLLNLQAPETESVSWQRRMQASLWRGGLGAVATADSLDELDAKEAAFERLASVYEVESIRDVLPPDQDEKLRIVRTLPSLVAPVRVERMPPVDIARLTGALTEMRQGMAMAAAMAPAEDRAGLAEIQATLDRTLARLTGAAPAHARTALAGLQADLHRELIGTLEGLRRELAPRPIELADVPDDLRRRYVSADRRFLLLIHPRVDAWERAEADAFVRDLRSIDAAVTGPAVINREALATMGRAWRQGTVYAYLLVSALSWLLIRRLRETAFALLPLVLGFVWTLGIMPVFGLTFTPANIFALPLLVGACAEFGLALVLSHMEQREGGGPLVARSAVTGVFLNGLTTMAGFGSLLVAQHHGIFGLGLLLTIGAAARLIASLVVLPALLRLFPSRPGR